MRIDENFLTDIGIWFTIIGIALYVLWLVVLLISWVWRTTSKVVRAYQEKNHDPN